MKIMPVTASYATYQKSDKYDNQSFGMTIMVDVASFDKALSTIEDPIIRGKVLKEVTSRLAGINRRPDDFFESVMEGLGAEPNLRPQAMVDGYDTGIAKLSLKQSDKDTSYLLSLDSPNLGHGEIKIDKTPDSIDIYKVFKFFIINSLEQSKKFGEYMDNLRISSAQKYEKMVADLSNSN